MRALVSRVFVACTVLALAGCGGGGGGSSVAPTPPAPPPPAANQPPTVSLGADASFDEKSEVTLSATASDRDGSISSYAWTQTAGETLDIGNTTSASLNFTAPVAKENITASFSVTVTDNEGLTASDDINITINPVNEVTFQAQGKVTNGSPFTANLNVRIGNVSTDFSTEADGSYTLDLAFDEDFANELLFITATSTSDSQIQFTNIPLTIGYLNNLAGSDNILTADEELSVNLTPLTTAVNGLLEQKIDISTASSDEVIQAYTSIQSESAANSSIAIKFISDGNFALPTEFNSTIEFSKNIKAIAESHYFIRTNYFDYDNVQLGLLNDPDITRFTIPNTPTQYQALISNQVFESGAVRLDYLEFQDNSTVYYHPRSPYTTPATNVNWSEDSNGSMILVSQDGSELANREFTTTQIVNNEVVDVRTIDSLKQKTLSLLLPLPNSALFLVSDEYEVSFPDTPQLTTEQYTYNETVNYIRTDANAFIQKTADELFADNSSIDLLLPVNLSPFFNADLTGPAGESTTISFSSDLFTLNREPGATSGSVIINFNLRDYLTRGTWELINGGTLNLSFILPVDSNSGFPVTLQYALADDNIATTLTLVETSDGEILDGVSAGTTAQDTFNGQYPTPESLIGVYTLPVNPGIFAGDYFWFELKADGTAQTVLTNDSNQNGTVDITISQREFNISTGIWSYNQATGILQVDTFKDFVNYSTNCDRFTNSNCVLFNTRSMKLVDITNDSYYVQHVNIFYGAGGETEVFSATSRELKFSNIPIVFTESSSSFASSLKSEIAKNYVFKDNLNPDKLSNRSHSNLERMRLY